jgi:hypothetical protein
LRAARQRQPGHIICWFDSRVLEGDAAVVGDSVKITLDIEMTRKGG